MSKIPLRLHAQKLRRAGASIRAITDTLGVSKSSVSNWCREIPLSKRQLHTLELNAQANRSKGRLIGAQRNRDAKLLAISTFENEGKEIASTLSDREALLIGAAIYWGEGSKVGQLSFINADKDMVLFMYRWFRSTLAVPTSDFMPRIYINQTHKGRKKLIENYWSQLLNIPATQFRSTVFINREQKKKYVNHDEYFGLLSLRIRRSTRLKYKILGLIQGLKYSTFR